MATGIYLSRLRNRYLIARDTVAFEFEMPSGFDFLPGQYLDLKAVNPDFTDPEGMGRDFSIASAPGEPHLMIATRLRPTPFKDFLRNAPLGTEMRIKGPAGSFVLGNADAVSVLIAGGIGVAPFRSMVKQASHEGWPRKIILFNANRRHEDAAFLTELHDLQLTASNFKFVPTMTREEEGGKWKGERGYIGFQMIEKYLDNPSAAHYYLAGPPAFTAAMWQMLKFGGIGEEAIRTEEFAGY